MGQSTLLSFLSFDSCHLAVPTVAPRLAACLTTGPCHMAWILCWLVVTLSHCSGENLTAAAGVNESYIIQDQGQESQTQRVFVDVCCNLGVRVSGGDESTSGWAKEYISTGILILNTSACALLGLCFWVRKDEWYMWLDACLV